MLDNETRLEAARQALHSLELRVEQLRFHLEGVAGHPDQSDRARALLDQMTTQLEWQRKYCDLLANAASSDAPAAKDGSSRVA